MPNAYITRVGKTCNRGIKELETLWEQAKTIAMKQYAISEDTPRFYALVMGIFKKSLGEECIEKLEAMSFVVDKIVAAAKEGTINPPRVNLLPKTINPEAVDIWKDVLRKDKNKNIIKSYTDPREKWAAAVVLFKQACAKKGIIPFSKKTTTRSAKAPVLTELAIRVDPLLKVLQKAENDLIKSGSLKKSTPKAFKLDSVKKKGTDYTVKASKIWKFTKTYSAASSVAQVLSPKYGFKKDGTNSFVKRKGPNTLIRIKYVRKGDLEATISIELNITAKLWRNIEASSNKPEVYLNRWMKRGFVSAAATDNIILDDVIPEVPNADEVIDTFYSIGGEEDAYLTMNKLTLPVIVNLGDDNFQQQLVSYIITKAKEYDAQLFEGLIQFRDDPIFREELRELYKDDKYSFPIKEDEGVALLPSLNIPN